MFVVVDDSGRVTFTLANRTSCGLNAPRLGMKQPLSPPANAACGRVDARAARPTGPVRSLSASAS
jgi:hypothetical protein